MNQHRWTTDAQFRAHLTEVLRRLNEQRVYPGVGKVSRQLGCSRTTLRNQLIRSGLMGPRGMAVTLLQMSNSIALPHDPRACNQCAEAEYQA